MPLLYDGRTEYFSSPLLSFGMIRPVIRTVKIHDDDDDDGATMESAQKCYGSEQP